MKKFICLLLIIPFSSTFADLRILSTTSTRDSGLYEYLLPIFEKKYDINSYVIATGQVMPLKMQNIVMATSLLHTLKILKNNL